IIEKALETKGRNISESTIAIQGFGKVGMHAAIEAHKLGGKVVAVSDVSGGLLNGDGLNIPELVKYYEENRTLKGFPNGQSITNEELLALQCDVLAPCALDGTINSNNANNIKASIIVEGANGPVTMNANEILRGKKIM